MKTDVVAISAARTPLGAFGGAFRDVPVYDLGASAIAAALRRAGLPGAAVDEVVFANCRQAGNGPNPSRTAAVRGGVPIPVPTSTVNMACPSSMKAVMLAAQALALGEARVVLAGGMESMSTMPYLLKDARWEGFKLGDRTLTDSWSDTVDPLCGYGMGMTAENLAEKYAITREAQDEYAARSHLEAARAQERGLLDAEIEPVQLPGTRQRPEGVVVTRDESIRPDTTPARLARLRPVFRKEGTITAGNACSMGDGACALVLTTREHAASLGARPLFSIVASAQTAVEPALMGDGPAHAIPLALQRARMTLRDMDFIEVNEAFSAQLLANERALGWDRARVNVHGGAVALGHPTGMSGARILIALDNVLRRRGAEHGVAAICGGGGVTTAMVIRREG